MLLIQSKITLLPLEIWVEEQAGFRRVYKLLSLHVDLLLTFSLWVSRRHLS